MALILDRLIEASFTWPSLLSFQFSKLLSYLLSATNLFAGTFGNRQLAAHGILMQYASLAYMVRGSSKQSLKVWFFFRLEKHILRNSLYFAKIGVYYYLEKLPVTIAKEF